MAETKIIFIHESVLGSIASDLVTGAILAGLIGLGVFLESSAMQWAGFLLVGMSIIGRASRMMSGKVRYTPQQAADYLQEKYGVTAAVNKP